MSKLLEIIINNKDKSLEEIIDKYIDKDKMKTLNKVIKELSNMGYEIISTDPFIVEKKS